MVYRGKAWYAAGILTAALIGAAGYGSAAQDGKPRTAQTAVKDARATEAALFFEAKVRPLLAEKCFSCHSSLARSVQGGLKLDSREALLKGGTRGAGLVPGDPEHSLLLTSLSYTVKDLKMPPSGKLKPAEIAALSAWVKMGAPWPAAAGPSAQATGKSSPPRSSANFWLFSRRISLRFPK